MIATVGMVYTSASNTVTFLNAAPLIGKSKDTFFFAGLWGRILVWNRRLETWERNDVLAILTDEWDIA